MVIIDILHELFAVPNDNWETEMKLKENNFYYYFFPCLHPTYKKQFEFIKVDLSIVKQTVNSYNTQCV